MLEFMKLGFAQIAFGGEGGGGGGGDDSSSRAPTSSPRPTPRPTPPPPPPRDDSDDDRRRQEEANRQAMLAAQMQQEQRARAAQEAAAAEAERQRQAAAQAEANRQAQAAREAAERQRQAAAQAEANRQAQEARQAAERQRQQQEAARRMEEQQRQEDEARQREEQQRRQEQALAAQRAQEQREREQREAAAAAAEAARRAQEDADRRAADQARLAEQRNQEAAARRAQEEAAIRAEQARAGIETLAPTISAPVTYTPRDDTFVDSILNVEDILAPEPSPADDVFQGPTLTGPGYTADPNITVNVDPNTGFITSETVSAPSGILTTQQAADQAAGIQDQQQAYQEMLARLRALQPPVPSTPAPVDFVPSQDLRDERGSVLPPPRDLSGAVSIGYGPGQVDPPLARAAGIQEGQPAFGQTTGPGTIEALYGVEDIFDFTPTPENLADLTLATGRTAETQQLLQARPDLVLPPTAPQTVVATGQVPAGTPGAAEPRDLFMRDEVQVLIDASPQARQVYESLGLTPFRVGTVSGAPVTNYRDAQGRVYSQAEARDFLRTQGAQTTTLPGGYTAVAPLGMTTPIAPVIDLGLTPVDIATPVTVTGAPGGGPSGGPGRGDPRDFGFSAEDAAASRRTSAPAGLEGLIDRSPTLGQPAMTTVPQASDIVLPGTDPALEIEVPEPLAAPDVVGGEPEAAEDVEVTVDTGTAEQVRAAEDAGYGYDMNGDDRVSIVEILTDMTNGGGPGQSGDQFEGGGILSDIGNALGGPGDGTGAGAGDGTGTSEDQEPDVEVEVPDEDTQAEEPVVEEPEEPAFECPPGFRRVQMANGGFTCVPEMVRPRVGPYTGTVDVSRLAGRTPFRPGTRRT